MKLIKQKNRPHETEEVCFLLHILKLQNFEKYFQISYLEIKML